jgi:hypothetical protein
MLNSGIRGQSPFHLVYISWVVGFRHLLTLHSHYLRMCSQVPGNACQHIGVVSCGTEVLTLKLIPAAFNSLVFELLEALWLMR